MSCSLSFIIACMILAFMHSAASEKTEKCGDNKKGMCGAGFYGWCYFDTNGTYNCDDDSYCANRQSLRGKIVGACFEDDTVCCCNNGDLCNINFLKLNHEKLPWTRTCTAALAEPSAEVQWKECYDAYCYTLAYTEDVTDKKYLIEGCHYQMHTFAETWKKEGEKRGHVLGQIAEQTSCYDIVESGKECVNTVTQYKGRQYTATLCCCGNGVVGNRTNCNDAYINAGKRAEALALSGDSNAAAKTLCTFSLFFFIFTFLFVFA